MNEYAKQIIRQLDKVTASGHRQSEIFEDWLDLVHASLKALPDHLRSAIAEKKLAPDTPETEALFKRLKERYPKDYCWEAFAEAWNILLDSTDGDDAAIAWDDTIGQVFMDWGYPNKWQGQFFTPYSLAQMMAQMTMQNIEEEIYQRIEDAYLKTPEGAMHKILAPERVSPFVRRMGEQIIPLCAEHIQPITVSDCCCGSGVMLLAAAQCTPRWALNWGLVQFYGQDIDATCVKMAQVNMMLYGLNGFNLKCALELSKAQLAAMPEPYGPAYQEAQDNPDRIEAIAVDLRSYQQSSLL